MFAFERKRAEEFLGGLKYPLSKEQILKKATEGNLPHQVQLLLQRLEDRQYGSAEEVEQELVAHKA